MSLDFDNSISNNGVFLQGKGESNYWPKSWSRTCPRPELHLFWSLINWIALKNEHVLVVLQPSAQLQELSAWSEPERGPGKSVFQTNQETGAYPKRQRAGLHGASLRLKERRDEFPDAVCNSNLPACFHSQRSCDTDRFDFVIISTHIPTARSPSCSSLAPSEHVLCSRVIAHLSRRTWHSWTPGFFFPGKWLEIAVITGGRGAIVLCLSLLFCGYFCNIF